MVEYPQFGASMKVEQKYFDQTHQVREDKRLARIRGVNTISDTKTRAAMKKDSSGIDALGSPDSAVAFERIDTESGECFYVGHHNISDSNSDLLVASWKTPFIADLKKSTPQNPGQVTRVRQFHVPGDPVNKITSIEDRVFAQLAQQISELEDGETALIEGDSFLQQVLESSGSGTAMHDIARTIQAAQMELIASPAEQFLLVQGGPGTGKTAVALHRVSWMLEQHNASHNTEYTLTSDDIAIIGPNPTFKRYIKDVLPILGDSNVPQFFTDEFIYPQIQTSRHDSKETAAFKGDRRMVILLRKAVRNRIRTPEENPKFKVKTHSWKLEISTTAITEFIDGCAKLPYRDGREAFRKRLTSHVLSELAAEIKERKTIHRGDVNSLINPNEIADYVNKVWPTFSSPDLLNDLLGSTERLIDADPTLSGADLRLLQRQRSDRLSAVEWTVEDLPLLDYIDHLLFGATELTAYEHIVVDEAQDLSAMQIEAIKRRSMSGYMTLVGDIAQITAPIERDSWSEVISQFDVSQTISEVSLSHGYRVPQEPMEVAAALLPAIAPGIDAPIVVRKAKTPPSFHGIDRDEYELGQYVCMRAKEFASKGRFLGIVVSPRARDEVVAELNKQDVTFTQADNGQLSDRINVITPEFAKGLEFESLIVVDPEGMVVDSDHGLRSLYIALTRTTRDLEVIFDEGTLPQELVEVAAKYGYVGKDLDNFTSQQAQVLDEEIAQALTETEEPPALAEPSQASVEESVAERPLPLPSRIGAVGKLLKKSADAIGSSTSHEKNSEKGEIPVSETASAAAQQLSTRQEQDMLSDLKPAMAESIREVGDELAVAVRAHISEEFAPKYQERVLAYLAHLLSTETESAE